MNKDAELILTSPGYKGLDYCNRLFEIEREIASFEVPKKTKARKEKSLPILEEFYKWAETENKKTFMSAKMSKALNYAINHKEKLCQFVHDGRIPLTNGEAERNIRPFAILRKNFLFSDTLSGANACAVMYSIVQTAKVNNLNIEKYINYLLEELPQLENPKDEESLKKFLPWSESLLAEIRQSADTEVAIDI